MGNFSVFGVDITSINSVLKRLAKYTVKPKGQGMNNMFFLFFFHEWK